MISTVDIIKTFQIQIAKLMINKIINYSNTIHWINNSKYYLYYTYLQTKYLIEKKKSLSN